MTLILEVKFGDDLLPSQISRIADREKVNSPSNLE